MPLLLRLYKGPVKLKSREIQILSHNRAPKPKPKKRDGVIRMQHPDPNEIWFLCTVQCHLQCVYNPKQLLIAHRLLKKSLKKSERVSSFYTFSNIMWIIKEITWNNLIIRLNKKKLWTSSLNDNNISPIPLLQIAS